ncbi:MAG: hypothetical protein LQ340_000958 [Diploschistes diacapsis]|nr:MAG: hypothetical protein LQ340_000958 [Diploschistes diacapsis]
MSVSEDLINFDIIETQKENIQSLPQGRSAKALASAFAPSPFSPLPTPGSTRNLNDALRAEYEAELLTINDSDDPLDIYDRYVKWTLNAYPSAQATPDSQLRPLLERATKAFQSSALYKNDPRYLKLWLQYIHLFSDAPRETFVYLARHNIGEGLALFYEEFAAWLEGVGRWTQAEEVYKLGVEREARPAERLLRKFGEFQQRFEVRPRNDDEPSSPALPTVRPALAAKLDPFSTSTARPGDPQAQRLPSNSVASRGGRQKLAIFSDADGSIAGRSESSDASKGWDNIGTIKERKKENTVEAKPWAGETLKAGNKVGKAPKMMVFRDQDTLNPKTGKTEHILANLRVVYPSEAQERCFEEAMARHRGWLDRTWSRQKNQASEILEVVDQSAMDVLQDTAFGHNGTSTSKDSSLQEVTSQEITSDTTLNDQLPSQDAENRHLREDGKEGRPRRKKTMEVKAGTQTGTSWTANNAELRADQSTVKTNLASPTAAKKIRRKSTAEPTMTLHSRAATDEVLDMFNQTLRNVASITDTPESGPESDYEDDDYTTGLDSTGRISGATSECGENTAALQTSSLGTEAEATDLKSVSPWSDFTRSKHVPQTHDGNGEVTEGDVISQEIIAPQEPEEVATPITGPQVQDLEKRFVPVPPEDFVVSTRPYRDTEEMNQNRLPFMTPIVEMTESSIHMPSTRQQDYFNSKTPSRRRNEDPTLPEIEDLLIDDSIGDAEKDSTSSSRQAQDMSQVNFDSQVGALGAKSPIIQDTQCNPMDDSIRAAILDNLQPPLSAYPGYFDHRPLSLNKGPEIRRYIKALLKNSSKTTTDKTLTALSSPPILEFPATSTSPSASASAPPTTLTIKRELGKGGYAPVYLAFTTSFSPPETSPCPLPPLLALKAEHPPTPWEYHLLTLSHSRLRSSPLSICNRATASLATPHSFHRFADEAYLLESYHDQGTLLDLVNASKADALASAGSSAAALAPGLEEAVAMFFSLELVRTVEALHAVGVLHGDLKGDNCLVRLGPGPPSNRSLLPSSSSSSSSSSSYSPPPPPPPPSSSSASSSASTAAAAAPDDPWSPRFSPTGGRGWAERGLALIDFGRGADMRAFRPGVGFVADWKTDRQDCPEMREARPWSWQVDLWGCAGVVHVLLFGKVIEEAVVVEKGGGGNVGGGCGGGGGGGEMGMGQKKRYKPREGLKRYWATDIWADLFDVLMNPARWAEWVPAGEGEQQQQQQQSAERGGTQTVPPTRRMRAVRERMEAWLVENAERKGLRNALRRAEDRVRVGAAAAGAGAGAGTGAGTGKKR